MIRGQMNDSGVVIDSKAGFSLIKAGRRWRGDWGVLVSFSNGFVVVCLIGTRREYSCRF